jgi:ATP-dependent DNA helicase RecG
MSATPIPRTLALALYADFDLSVIDQMPPGRQAVTTKLVSAGRQDAAYKVLREKVEGGEQGFVVCPLIDPSPEVDADAAAELYETLAAGPLEGLRVGLVHGRMATPERQAVMAEFYRGEIGVLVSTTVIEVGLDVPNASVILIQNAERFGLAQLHQLRGRVARSRHRPLCVLVSGRGGETSNERLKVMAATNDGFRIAEADLMQRGAGELAGLRQHGLGDGIVADVLKHPELLAQARAEAAKVLEADPELARPEHRALAEVVAEMGDLEEGRWAL